MKYSVFSDVRMLVRGHVELGEERQADYVGDGTDQQQLGAADAGDSAATDTTYSDPGQQLTLFTDAV